MRRALLFVLLCAIAWPAAAQERLTLPEAILLAEAEGPSAEIARLRYRQQEESFDVFQARYRPTFALTGSAPGLERTIDQVQQDDGTFEYVPQSRLFSQANLAARQVLPWTGGEVFVSSRLGRLDLFGDREFSQWNAAPVVVGIEQPLFRFNNYKWERRLEPLRFQVANRALTGDLAEVAVTVTERFFDAYVARIDVDIAAFNVAVNDTIYTLSQGRYEIGRIAENDLLQSELALLNAQSALSSARLARDEALQDLRLVLGLPEGASVTAVPPSALPDLTGLDPERAVAQARQHRAAFLDLRRQRLEAERNLAQAERSNGFGATISAQYGLNQSAGTLDQAYVNPLDQQRFGVGFELPLYHWGRSRSEVDAAQAAREETRLATTLAEDRLRQEVYFEARRLKELRNQVQIAAKADTVAARRFEVARNRYRVGNIDITDLLNAQREKDTARRSFIQTQRQFWTAFYRLRRLTLYDFAVDQPL